LTTTSSPMTTSDALLLRPPPMPCSASADNLLWLPAPPPPTSAPMPMTCYWPSTHINATRRRHGLDCFILIFRVFCVKLRGQLGTGPGFFKNYGKLTLPADLTGAHD
jgi:hypothetical protein